jgi:hypothetical protein
MTIARLAVNVIAATVLASSAIAERGKGRTMICPRALGYAFLPGEHHFGLQIQCVSCALLSIEASPLWFSCCSV